jgi:hypothetical protein
VTALAGDSEMTDEQMRHAIMNQITCTGNSAPADTWFSLIFASTETLRNICKKLGINP